VDEKVDEAARLVEEFEGGPMDKEVVEEEG